MKIYAIINWGEGEPKITAINGMACVATDRTILEAGFELVKRTFEAEVRFEIVEFESKEN